MPIIPLRDIKIRSARELKKSIIVSGNWHQSKSTRNVKGILNVMTSALDKRDISFETHTFHVLWKYDSECTTTLDQFLKYRYDRRATLTPESHKCVKLNGTVLDHEKENEQK